MSTELRPMTARRTPDAGISFVELIITMALVAVVLPMIMGLLIILQKQAATTVNTVDAASDARLAMESIDFQVRSGSVGQNFEMGPYLLNSDASASPTTSSIGFWTGFTKTGVVLASGSGRCVQFAIDTSAGTLSTRSFAAGAGRSAAGRGMWTVVARHIVAGSVFSTTTADGLAASASDPATQVGVHLRTQAVTGASNGRVSAIDSTLTLRDTTAASDADPSAPNCGLFT